VTSKQAKWNVPSEVYATIGVPGTQEHQGHFREVAVTFRVDTDCSSTQAMTCFRFHKTCSSSLCLCCSLRDLFPLPDGPSRYSEPCGLIKSNWPSKPPSWTSALLQSSSSRAEYPKISCLSWDSYLLPSAVRFNARPLPDCRNSPSGLGCKTKTAFRSRGFSPPQRFAPHNESGCVATRADHGVHCVSSGCWPELARTSAPFPQCEGTPWRIPLVSSSSASLRPVPSCRYYTTCVPQSHTKLRRVSNRPEINQKIGKPFYQLLSKRADAETFAPAKSVSVQRNVLFLTRRLDESSHSPRWARHKIPFRVVARQTFGRNQGSVTSLYQLPINQILAPTCATQPKQGRLSSLAVVEAEAWTAEKGCHRRALNRIPDDKSSVLQAALVLRRVPDGQGHLIRRRRQGD